MGPDCLDFCPDSATFQLCDPGEVHSLLWASFLHLVLSLHHHSHKYLLRVYQVPGTGLSNTFSSSPLSCGAMALGKNLECSKWLVNVTSRLLLLLLLLSLPTLIML